MSRLTTSDISQLLVAAFINSDWPSHYVSTGPTLDTAVLMYCNWWTLLRLSACRLQCAL